jgi:hypothetical protein
MLHNKGIVDMMMRECDKSYRTPEQRAAYRAGLSTAFAACDHISKEIGNKNKSTRERAAVAKLCGDMIEGLRDMITVREKEDQ